MTRALRTVVDVRAHPLGPRVYVAGQRVHECWAGLFTTIAVAMGHATGRTGPHPLDTVVVIVAAWMMLKDWPDFFPSRRDTYGWRVGFHRRPTEPIPVRTDENQVSR